MRARSSSVRRVAARAAILVSRASRVSMISGNRSAWSRIASTIREEACCWRPVTTVPSPWRTATTPITSSATRAWLSVARLTPRRCASSRSAGSRSPASRPLSVIQAEIWPATCSYSRVRSRRGGNDSDMDPPY